MTDGAKMHGAAGGAKTGGVADGAKTGALLVQLGTPKSPAVGDVRRYLREFLSDPRVVDLPAPARWLLVNGVIAPFRAPRSARAYRQIWTPQGSPLLLHSRALARAVAAALGPDFCVALAMRYGAPGIEAALRNLCAAGVRRIAVLPLFPQWAEASSGSALARVRALHSRLPNAPPLCIAPAFFDAADFIAAAAKAAAPALAKFGADHVLFSYHGLPERQVRRADSSGAHCLVRGDCCAAVGPVNAHCYRAQCLATSRALAAALSLAPDAWSDAFQSRLGRARWIGPATDQVLPQLAARGVRRLAVLCPSFVADCLETLEEIGLRARDQWRSCGGEALQCLPCVNASPDFAAAAAAMLRRAAEN